jgi:hypothetical protein
MQHAAPMTQPTESIYTVLASSARKLSDLELGAIAVLSGIVALAATVRGAGTWELLGCCYVAWCFAGWGIVFRSRLERSAPWRALELLIAGSGTIMFAVLGTGLFFWALGSYWKL